MQNNQKYPLNSVIVTGYCNSGYIFHCCFIAELISKIAASLGSFVSQHECFAWIFEIYLQSSKKNPFSGTNSEVCLCESGIDPQTYQHCVLNKGFYASLASAKYSQLGLDACPVIDVGYKNTVFGVDENWYLKKICTVFGDNPPRGCIKPFACNSTCEFSERKGVTSFNCNCFNSCSNLPLTTEADTRTTPATKLTDLFDIHHWFNFNSIQRVAFLK